MSRHNMVTIDFHFGEISLLPSVTFEMEDRISQSIRVFVEMLDEPSRRAKDCLTEIHDQTPARYNKK